MDISLKQTAITNAKKSSDTKAITISLSAAEFIELTKKSRSANVTPQQLLKRLALEHIKPRQRFDEF